MAVSDKCCAKSKFNIGILGMGTVGTGTVRILQENTEDIELRSDASVCVKKVLVRNKNKKRDINLPEEAITDNVNEILDDPDIHIIVELIGGVNPAFSYIMSAIENGKHIVTANKEVMAKHGHEILQRAEEKGVQVFFEASVAGGIPIIKPLKESLAGNKIQQIMGIINGTTNYILTKMTQEGSNFEEVLKEAQVKGYAEANPDSDVLGFDAAYKIAILGSIAFNSQVDIEKVYVEGITSITAEDIEYARELDYVIKLLAIGKEIGDKIELRVHPTLVPRSHPLASVNDVFNAVFIKGNAVGDLMFYGRGAGDLPTGSSVVGDLIALINKINQGHQSSKVCSCYHKKELIGEDQFYTRFYIRLMVKEKPGVLAKITKVFAKHNVSISSVIQKERGDSVPLVFVTYEVVESNMRAALAEIKEIDDVNSIANTIRVEGE